MKIVDNYAEKKHRHDEGKTLVKEINSLIQESFGYGFIGDGAFKKTMWGDTIKPSQLGYRLGMILKKGDEIGRFSEEDGSSVTVIPQYREEAIRFARLYEKKFHKNVELTIDEKIYRLFDYEAGWQDERGEFR